MGAAVYEQSARTLIGAGSMTRLSYGLGALLAPDVMSLRRLAPDIRGHADGRMDFRGFGDCTSASRC